LALRGSLTETDPEDVLQILAMGAKTGILRVLDSGHTTELVLEKGRIIDAFDGVHRGEDAVFNLLARRSGSFNFQAQEVSGERTIERDVQSILLSAARRLDGLAYAKKLLGQPMARPYVADPESDDPSTVTEAHRAVLSLIDGNRTLGEIAAGSGLAWEDAYSALGHLVELGMVRLATAQSEASPLSGQTHSEALDDVGLPAERSADSDRPPTPGDIRAVIEYLRRTEAARPPAE
jgi:hypothetical protein